MDTRMNKNNKNAVPEMLSAVQAGFASAADDHIERHLDLNELVIKQPEATFFVRVQGDSMLEAGIQTGDILVVDRSREAIHGKIVIAVIDGEFTVKTLHIDKKGLFLMASNKRYKPLKIDPESDFSIWGVVTYVISPR
jgi:DNA polymerase V